jgi:predicted dehydrogenase
LVYRGAEKTKPQLKVMEAFMYRVHPQWQKAKQMVIEGKIGEIRTIQSFFSYNNLDSTNIRNIAEYGGGGLMDIGCYCISLSRFLFNSEPERVIAIVEYDPALNIDRLTSGILDFGKGTSTFTCATQLESFQCVNIFGTIGRIEIEIPFNAPPDRPCKIWIQNESEIRQIEIDSCDQYTIQGDLFSQAIINNTAVPTLIQDAVENMKVLENIIQSANNNEWIYT